MIRYAVFAKHPEAHLFEVGCTVASPDPEGQRFMLPAWIPGSYLIRDFARHIVSIRAEAHGRAVALTKLDKHTWRAAPTAHGALTVTCEIYAWDLSVRGAHLDTTHGFFNGTSVFLRVIGAEDAPCLVDIRPPEGERYRAWRVATTLEPARREPGAARAHGFGLYRAAHYDELIDHPVEMGAFSLARFEACGVPHEVALTGRSSCDTERLARDLKRVCEWQIRLFGEAPMSRYVFLVMVVGEGYGGLEHRASSALLCSRNDLPAPGTSEMTDAYRGFLGLASHEYFHTWNVKRIKPAAFVPYDLERESHTSLLWAFEGITSYYDDLALLRSRVIGVEDYLKLLARTITNVQRTPGRLKQSVAASSFDAWTKYYRQDENSPNAIVSYYAKGALVALALDLRLRTCTGNRVSLDTVMRELWRRHGRTGVGVPEDGVQRVAQESSGLKLGRFFREAVHGTRDLPLQQLLRQAGVVLEWHTESRTPALGVRTSAEGADLKLANVFDGGAAQQAGLSAGDVLMAIDGLRVGKDNLDKLLSRYRPGDAVGIHAFRREELMCFEATLQPAPSDLCRLTLSAKPDAAAKRLRRAWLGL
jgi:predicted metalloprotease with PDZ domain